MERTWSVAGVYGMWKLTVALVPEKVDPEEDYPYQFTPTETLLALKHFTSLNPHFMDVVNLVECRSTSELERHGTRITQWG